MALHTSKTGSSTVCRTISCLYAKQTVPFSQMRHERVFPAGNTNLRTTLPLEERMEHTCAKSSFKFLESTKSGSVLNIFLTQNVHNITRKEVFGMNLPGYSPGNIGPEVVDDASGCTEMRSTTLQDFFSAWRGGLICSLSRGSSQLGHGPAQLQQQRTFIQLKSKLTVADNSGAKVVECIQTMNKTRGARLGDKIIASVKEVVGRGKVKKGEVVYCVIVRARMKRGRCDGSEVRFDDNAVVLINKQGEPIGTRIMGPVCHELREKKMVKVLSLAEYVA